MRLNGIIHPRQGNRDNVVICIVEIDIRCPYTIYVWKKWMMSASVFLKFVIAPFVPIAFIITFTFFVLLILLLSLSVLFDEYRTVRIVTRTTRKRRKCAFLLKKKKSSIE